MLKNAFGTSLARKNAERQQWRNICRRFRNEVHHGEKLRHGEHSRSVLVLDAGGRDQAVSCRSEQRQSAGKSRRWPVIYRLRMKVCTLSKRTVVCRGPTTRLCIRVRTGWSTTILFTTDGPCPMATSCTQPIAVRGKSTDKSTRSGNAALPPHGRQSSHPLQRDASHSGGKLSCGVAARKVICRGDSGWQSRAVVCCTGAAGDGAASGQRLERLQRRA